MSEWLPMLLFLSGLIGTGVLVMACGAANMRAEQAAAQGSAPAEGAGENRFAPPRMVGSVMHVRIASREFLNGRLEAALQDFLAREAHLAEEFVSRPSLESLYCDAQRPVAPKDLTRYLERELEFAAGFAADPSVESLYLRSERPAWIN